MSLLTLHQGFSRVLLIYSLIIAIWGIFLFLRRLNPSGSYLGAVFLDEGVAILQGLLGLGLLLQGHRPADGLHYLYGLVAVLVVPSAYLFSKRGTERRDSLIFGLAGLFLVGVAIRGITTGAGH